MTRYIDAEKIPYTTLYKENFLKGTGVEAQGAWKSDIDSIPTVDAVPITFERFRFVCKFFAVGFDEDRQIELTCRRKDMIPEGSSWGICDQEHCPYMQEEKKNETD